MRKRELIENFANNVEKERIRLGFTQHKMANKLGISLTSYKRLISMQNVKIDVYTLVRLYEITGKFAFEFLGISDYKTKLVSDLNHLDRQQINFIQNIVDFEQHFSQNHDNFEDYITLFIPGFDETKIKKYKEIRG